MFAGVSAPTNGSSWFSSIFPGKPTTENQAAIKPRKVRTVT